MTYRSDEEAQAYKRIADLEEENRKLRVSATSQARPRREWKLPTVDFERLFTWTGWSALVAIGLFVGYVLLHVAMRSNEVTHCYIIEYAPSKEPAAYGLKGSRDWNDDIFISRHDSIVNATKAAEMLKCPLLKK